MKKIMLILGTGIVLSLLTVAAAVSGWWTGVSLPLDISNGERQILALSIAFAFTWGTYTLSCKTLTQISMITSRFIRHK